VNAVVGFQHSDAGRTLARLSSDLGDTYPILLARGAAMTANSVLDYAQQQTTGTTVANWLTGTRVRPVSRRPRESLIVTSFSRTT